MHDRSHWGLVAGWWWMAFGRLGWDFWMPRGTSLAALSVAELDAQLTWHATRSTTADRQAERQRLLTCRVKAASGGQCAREHQDWNICVQDPKCLACTYHDNLREIFVARRQEREAYRLLLQIRIIIRDIEAT